jgi:hypothetical protein
MIFESILAVVKPVYAVLQIGFCMVQRIIDETLVVQGPLIVHVFLQLGVVTFLGVAQVILGDIFGKC